MCGIAGFIGATSPGIDSNNALRKMAQAIAHRGPDDEGFLFASAARGSVAIGLAHRRLSIIDLGTGHQPLGNEDGRVQIVFNGEIYNFQELRRELQACGHAFKTASDTEVIVHAYEQWGDECVQRLRGMFAFALWDGGRERLMLARDRFGKKPLFLRSQDGVLLFASEIKALLTWPGVQAEVDMNAVWDYFSYRYVPGPATLFAGISKLPPGSYAVWSDGRLQQHRYFASPDGRPRAREPVPKNPEVELLKRLDESVAMRMVADVPFGAFLSGGIDSSAVVALMTRHAEQPIKTFSVGFDDPACNELGYARVVAERLGTDHHELLVAPDQIIAQLPTLIGFRDAPISEPSDVPIYLMAKAARCHVKMVLTGEGADEILGGYPKHRFEPFGRYYRYLPGGLRHGVIEPLLDHLPFAFRRARTALTCLGLDHFDERMARWFGAMSTGERARLVAFSPNGAQLSESSLFAPAGTMRTAVDGRGAGPGRALQFDSAPEASPLRRILYFDQTSWLPDNLLERGDRMTMAVGLEARMPFMDHELAGWVARLPDRYRVRGMTGKWLLREAARELLPQEILHRKKLGFRVPIDQWLRGPMRAFLLDNLSGGQARTAVYYRPAALQRVIDEHLSGRVNHEKLLWSLLNLELWCRHFGIS
ncbi:Asparagine synthase [Burkholderiales bacterium]|jgi:asparagine synthase (glutamine-hydrolysing)|nr:Asparagine synthase [Burkholderiales bacterium]